jgi:hypothetical protein
LGLQRRPGKEPCRFATVTEETGKGRMIWDSEIQKEEVEWKTAEENEGKEGINETERTEQTL